MVLSTDLMVWFLPCHKVRMILKHSVSQSGMVIIIHYGVCSNVRINLAYIFTANLTPAGCSTDVLLGSWKGVNYL